MSAIRASHEQTGPRAEALQRWLLYGAVILTGLALVHHADHVIRGVLVVENGLSPDWNHSGWPFRNEVNPFTASLAVYLLFGAGIVLSLRRRAVANYWLGAGIVLEAVLLLVHFLPGNPKTEWPSVIYQTYGSPLPGALALLVLFALVAGLILQVAQAIRLRRASRG